MTKQTTRSIYWFSGSGNSLYTACRLSEILGGTLHKIHTGAEGPGSGDSELGLVFPVHSFRIPVLVKKWIERTDLSNIRECWAVMTMGGGAYNAPDELRGLFARKGVPLLSVQTIVYPDNCIYLYNANSCRGDAVTRPILAGAEDALRNAAANIQQKKEIFPERKNPLAGFLLSGVLGSLFLSGVEKAKKRPWTVSDKCIICGQCAAVCPSHNIVITNGKPVWGTACVLCMACIQWCPAHAINYRSATAARLRYHHPKADVKQLSQG